MKIITNKTSSYILILLLVIGIFIGCSKNNSNKETTTPNTTTKKDNLSKTTHSNQKSKARNTKEEIKEKIKFFSVGKTIFFEYPTVDGKTITSNDLKGKFVLINVFATYCPPCVKELPLFSEIKSKYKNQNFEILAVSSDYYYKDPVKLAKYIISFFDKNHIKRNFIVAFGREKITKYFGTISGIPTSFFIGPDGKLIVFKNTETGEEGSVFNGAFSKEILEALVELLLNSKANNKLSTNKKILSGEHNNEEF